MATEDLITVLAEFLDENITDDEQLARDLHDTRVADGILAPPWFDPQFDSQMTRCQAHRNVTRWASQTGNRWLLVQLAVMYSGHPMWNAAWTHGVTDEYRQL